MCHQYFIGVSDLVEVASFSRLEETSGAKNHVGGAHMVQTENPTDL